MTDAERIVAELVKPLDKRFVKPPPKGKFGEYIEGWHAIAEANRIFGYLGWSYSIGSLVRTNAETVTLGDGSEQHCAGYLATVIVEAGGVTRQDVGHGQGYSKTSWGDAHESAVKEAVTDALKRALRTYGNPFGLALYDKSHSQIRDVAADRRAVEQAAHDISAAQNIVQLKQVWRDVHNYWCGEPPDALCGLKETRKAELTSETNPNNEDITA